MIARAIRSGRAAFVSVGQIAAYALGSIIGLALLLLPVFGLLVILRAAVLRLLELLA